MTHAAEALEARAASDFSVVVPLRDGGLIRIRAIRPDDKERLLDHFRRLSPASIYQRFFGVKKALTPLELKLFTEMDFEDDVGLAATIGDGPSERFVGVGRYVLEEARAHAGQRRAEVAFAVADEHQGRGIATQLLAQLVPFARKNRIAALDAEVLNENVHMLHVFSRMGFAARHPASGGTLQLSLPIEQAAKAPALGRPRSGFLGERAEDAMTRQVVTIAPETELQEIEAIFELHSFNGLPVVAAGGRLLGLLTKLDLLRAFAFSERTIVPHYEELSHLTAASVMTRDPVTVPKELPLTRVLEELVRTRYKSLPVVEHGRLVGIVSREDVLKALRRASAHQPVPEPQPA